MCTTNSAYVLCKEENKGQLAQKTVKINVTEPFAKYHNSQALSKDDIVTLKKAGFHINPDIVVGVNKELETAVLLYESITPGSTIGLDQEQVALLKNYNALILEMAEVAPVTITASTDVKKNKTFLNAMKDRAWGAWTTTVGIAATLNAFKMLGGLATDIANPTENKNATWIPSLSGFYKGAALASIIALGNCIYGAYCDSHPSKKPKNVA